MFYVGRPQPKCGEQAQCTNAIKIIT